MLTVWGAAAWSIRETSYYLYDFFENLKLYQNKKYVF